MTPLKNKIDFALLVSATMSNPNGDPLNGNEPRQSYEGFGEISDVCIKRKIRNRMQDLGNKVFVQSDDRCDDGCASLKDRADKCEALHPVDKKTNKKTKLSDAEFAKAACNEWLDVRSFGALFAYSEKTDKKGVSVGVRGPVSIHQAVSVSPVEIESMQITKSVSGERDSNAEKSSDTMGTKNFVRFGLYVIKGSINVQLAEKTGFSEQDAETIKECLRTLFVNDASAARPDGSMQVHKLYWWQHNCKDGQYSPAKVHASLHVSLKDGAKTPTSFDDYNVELVKLNNLKPEVIEGF